MSTDTFQQAYITGKRGAIVCVELDTLQDGRMVGTCEHDHITQAQAIKGLEKAFPTFTFTASTLDHMFWSTIGTPHKETQA